MQVKNNIPVKVCGYVEKRENYVEKREKARQMACP